MNGLAERRLAVSVDVGGTFTDVVTLDLDTGETVVGKRPTRADAPAEGIVDALGATEAELSEIERFVHGTTIGINTLLQRRGAKVGFLTTRGFRDMLAIREGRWPAFRLTWERPDALVPRRWCVEVDERVRADGSVLVAIDVDQVLAQARSLVDQGVEAVAVCFVNAYLAPEHERLAAEAIRQEFPDLVVAASHELTRRYREFARAETVVGEAYLRPVMQRYFDRLETGMAAGGFAGRTLITSSDGGVMGIGLARRRALRSLVSGCASGVAGAAVVASSGGWRDVIAIDMGGTSFDAALIHDGQPSMSSTAEVAGQQYLMPMLDLATIGAGGGSIAAIDAAGGLDVGPRSAGSAPGPACYGRGGTEPTFTDAALVAGLLPTALLDGGMTLDHAAGLEAVTRVVAGPLGIDVQEAAAGILAIVEAKMARLLEEITVGHGLDPRGFTVFAYGGGGPLVAARLATELGIRRVVVPPDPGVFSAWGMQTLDIVHELSRTVILDPARSTPAELEAPLAEMAEEARAALAADDVAPDDVTLLPFVEMRYAGQEHTMLIPFGTGGEPALRRAFDAAHQAAFGFAVAGASEIVAFRLRAVGALPSPPAGGVPATDAEHRPAGTRIVHERGAGAGAWQIWRRNDLGVGRAVAGPAIVEELTTTTVVPAGWTATRDPQGNLVIER